MQDLYTYVVQIQPRISKYVPDNPEFTVSTRDHELDNAWYISGIFLP